MTAPIPFDPARFRSAAAHYLDGRPDYAAGLIRAVATICGLDGGGQMLDLGCGPGQIAAAFRPFVAGALGMDPEPEMLAIARDRAASAGLAITFEEGASHDLAPGMGPFRLVTIGRAFHWMDRPATLAALDGLVEPGGAVVLFGTSHPNVPDNAWSAPLQSAQDAVIGAARPAWRQPGWVSNDAVLLDSPFSELCRVGVIKRRHTPAAHFVDRALSRSTSTRARIGDEGAARLTADILRIMGERAVDGMVTEVVESVGLIARRPGPLP